MESIFYVSFICSLVLLIHSYGVYPLSLFLLEKFRGKKFKETISTKYNLSVIISAYNEQNVIENTIRSLLQSDYDINNIEIVIGSDNSNDNTNEIIERLKKEFANIVFLPFTERRGKANVLNDLVKLAVGEIIIFCDANTIYDKNALKELTKYFADDRIGGVCGRLVLLEFEKAKREGNQEKEYWKYESWIKYFEGKLGFLIGANGGIYSIRKELFENIPSEFPVTDDFLVSMKVLEQYKEFTYNDNAIAKEYIAPSVEWEFKRKVRMISTNFDTLRYLKKLLSPKYGLIAYAFWSHKIIRWFTPFLLIIILLSNFFLLHIPAFKYLFFGQIIFYASAIIGFIFAKLKINAKIFSLSYYFVITNIAILVGIYRFIMKKQSAAWQSTERVQ